MVDDSNAIISPLSRLVVWLTTAPNHRGCFCFRSGCRLCEHIVVAVVVRCQCCCCCCRCSLFVVRCGCRRFRCCLRCCCRRSLTVVVVAVVVAVAVRCRCCRQSLSVVFIVTVVRCRYRRLTIRSFVVVHCHRRRRCLLSCCRCSLSSFVAV